MQCVLKRNVFALTKEKENNGKKVGTIGYFAVPFQAYINYSKKKIPYFLI